MTVTDNLSGLLKALNGRNWFRMLPIIADAYGDMDDWEAVEAIRWIIENKAKPKRVEDRRFGWMHDRATGHRLRRHTSETFDKATCEFNNGQMWTYSIAPQLTGFIAAWKQGLRP